MTVIDIHIFISKTHIVQIVNIVVSKKYIFCIFFFSCRYFTVFKRKYRYQYQFCKTEQYQFSVTNSALACLATSKDFPARLLDHVILWWAWNIGGLNKIRNGNGGCGSADGKSGLTCKLSNLLFYNNSYLLCIVPTLVSLHCFFSCWGSCRPEQHITDTTLVHSVQFL